jgi:hypothetical protein
MSAVQSAAELAVSTAAVQKAVMGAEIITKTLDAVNRYDDGSGKKDELAASYEFQKSVLSAAFSPKGIVTDVSG